MTCNARHVFSPLKNSYLISVIKNDSSLNKWEENEGKKKETEYRRQLFCIVSSCATVPIKHVIFPIHFVRAISASTEKKNVLQPSYSSEKREKERESVEFFRDIRRIELSRCLAIIGAEDRILHWNSWIDERGCFLQRVTTASSCDTQIRAAGKSKSDL